MLAAGGTVVVSCLRDRCCGSVGCRIDVAPSECIGIKHPHSAILFYSLAVRAFTSKEINPLSNSDGCMSCSGSWHFAIFSLS